jgi:hypothetical protein
MQKQEKQVTTINNDNNVRLLVHPHCDHLKIMLQVSSNVQFIQSQSPSLIHFVIVVHLPHARPPSVIEE